MARRPVDRESGHFRNDGSEKRAHVTRERAFRVAEHLRKVYRTGRALNVYPCGACGGWHVGRKRSRRK